VHRLAHAERASRRETYRPYQRLPRLQARRSAARLRGLSGRERRDVELRFRFGGGPASLQAIGKELGLSREHIRHFQDEAFERLVFELDLAEQL
jgi:DNA-directed RNA polymerase sigma subunit (sigma70/sigma32)